MTINNITTTITGPGPLVTLDTLSEILVVSQTGQLLAEGPGGAVAVTGFGTRATIFGLVSGEEYGMDCRLAGGTVQVTIGATGTVFGALTGIDFGASSQFSNYGAVFGGERGVVVGGGGSSSSIVNHGLIHGDLSAIYRPAGVLTSMRLINYGTISANENNDAIFSSPSNAVDVVFNRGLISGHVYLGGGSDFYDGRSGTLEGDLYFGDGGDFFDGRNGVVEGVIRGEAGFDTFRPGVGVEIIYGGNDVDELDFSRTNTISVALDGSFAGTAAAAGDIYADIENVIGSTFGNDRIRGDGANNGLFGLGGNDSMDGAGGNDSLGGGDGNDTLLGSEGLDELYGGADNDMLFGGADDDSIDGGFGINTLDGGSGNDTITMTGSGQILAGIGNDVVSEGVEIALVDLGDGNDTVTSGGGGDTLIGGLGIDTLDLRNIVSGLTINLATGFNTTGDTISGFENVEGSDFGGDFLIGTADANFFVGNDGDDFLFGDAGNDTIFGGTGIDQIVGGLGADTLSGGLGDDLFIFQSLGERTDRIGDFSNVALNDDLLVFIAAGFGGGLVGTGFATLIDPTQFQSRSDNLAQDLNDRFIFRTTDRSLWFDTNGSLAGGASLIAFVQVGAVVTANDIFIV